jgi:ribosome-associated protein
MIAITDDWGIDEREISETFIHGTGRGGQAINKVSNTAQLRFDVRGSHSLPDEVRARLERTMRSRITHDGFLVITARRYRSQMQNRQDARDRLVAMIRRAAAPRRPRRATFPPQASLEERLHEKAHRAEIKRERRVPDDEP